MEVLVVVDMQNDFIDGSLGTKEAVSIVPKVADKIKNFKGMVLATRDTHEENYLEFIAKDKLRDKLNLEDGDTVSVEF